MLFYIGFFRLFEKRHVQDPAKTYVYDTFIPLNDSLNPCVVIDEMRHLSDESCYFILTENNTK